MIVFLPVESVFTGLFSAKFASLRKKGLNMISKGPAVLRLRDV